jgi:hypothetical protein
MSGITEETFQKLNSIKNDSSYFNENARLKLATILDNTTIDNLKNDTIKLKNLHKILVSVSDSIDIFIDAYSSKTRYITKVHDYSIKLDIIDNIKKEVAVSYKDAIKLRDEKESFNEVLNKKTSSGVGDVLSKHMYPGVNGGKCKTNKRKTNKRKTNKHKTNKRNTNKRKINKRKINKH